ncbi:N-acetylmannosamine-6-phosphate 2-epimerase [Bacillus sp. FJAT-50079]|uniref:N-acetylmannosamine-6-phosphate 2-epimerase n=1 Tax=Bacillus sp. FJAT-50079 TaxID=2833577 RepID=UPI001BCA5F7C|nr:N-acetylmannosamine-6-phosphate 2-epimerase [Bacillus sp. FJAT-50079]MBS4209981.1 N-acetylmannosamine-6-phosphate 2-epimerase [Bacillus sp. FJAT-50079]
MRKDDILQAVKGGLIVSCQALEDEPLHSSFIMGRMAYAALEGGAVGIRSNSPADIKEIKKTVNLPVIGLLKKNYGDNPVFITPTLKEIKEVYEAGADIVAFDATDRKRPDDMPLEELVKKAKELFPNIILMGDISKFSEGVECERLGVDMVGSTLAGYTEETKHRSLPDFDLLKELTTSLTIPVIAEGHIWSPEELQKAYEQGIHTAVVGSAITRPREITKRFVAAIQTKSIEEMEE